MTEILVYFTYLNPSKLKLNKSGLPNGPSTVYQYFLTENIMVSFYISAAIYLRRWFTQNVQEKSEKPRKLI